MMMVNKIRLRSKV